MDKNGKKSAKKTMLITISVVIAAAVVFAGVQILINNNKEGDFGKIVEEINAEKLYESIENDESFVLFYGSESCSHCQNYKPVFAEAYNSVNKDITVYYIDADTLAENDKLRITSYFGIEGTPTVFTIVNGNVKNSIAGEQTQEVTENFFNSFVESQNNEEE